MTSCITVEQRRKNLCRQCRRDKQRIALQGANDELAQTTSQRRIFSELLIVLGARRLMTCGHSSVDPLGCVHLLPCFSDLSWGQNGRYRDNHVAKLNKRSLETER